MKEDPKYGAWTEANVLDVAKLAQKIAAGADVNRPMNARQACFPLAVAVEHGSIEACRLLLAAGANPDLAEPPSFSPFYRLVGRRQLSRMRQEPVMPDSVMRDVFALLVSYGANPNGAKKFDDYQREWESPLYLAATDFDVAAVEALAASGADLNRKVSHTFMDASFDRVTDIEPVLFFLREAAVPDNSNSGKAQDIMLTLLKLGADDACLAGACFGLNPFQEAVRAGYDKVVGYYVRERGEDLAQRVNGRTLLQIASHDSTRTLIRSLKTELAVQSSVVSNISEGVDQPVSPSKKRVGVWVL